MRYLRAVYLPIALIGMVEILSAAGQATPQATPVYSDSMRWYYSAIRDFERAKGVRRLSPTDASTDASTLQTIGGLAKQYGTPVGTSGSGVKIYSLTNKEISHAKIVTYLVEQGATRSYADLQAGRILQLLKNSKTKQFGVFLIGAGAGAFVVEQFGSSWSPVLKYFVIAGCGLGLLAFFAYLVSSGKARP